mgnify:CR=1 FL=1
MKGKISGRFALKTPQKTWEDCQFQTDKAEDLLLLEYRQLLSLIIYNIFISSQKNQKIFTDGRPPKLFAGHIFPKKWQTPQIAFTRWLRYLQSKMEPFPLIRTLH